jgi:hypothetical protein
MMRGTDCRLVQKTLAAGWAGVMARLSDSSQAAGRKLTNDETGDEVEGTLP